MKHDDVRRLLGEVPTDPFGGTWPGETCSACDESFDADEIAWGTYHYDGDEQADVLCVRCALRQELEREASPLAAGHVPFASALMVGLAGFVAAIALGLEEGDR